MAGRDAVGGGVDVLVAAVAVDMTGVGVDCAGRDVVRGRGFGAGLSVVGTSGLGASVCVPLVRDEPDDGLTGACDPLVRDALDDPVAGASAICGVASLRAPTGGSSGVGPDAAKAGAESAAASTAEHAATAIPPRRSIRRRDDVLVDTRPSLLR